jgi:hypothetical protein
MSDKKVNVKIKFYDLKSGGWNFKVVGSGVKKMGFEFTNDAKKWAEQKGYTVTEIILKN